MDHLSQDGEGRPTCWGSNGWSINIWRRQRTFSLHLQNIATVKASKRCSTSPLTKNYHTRLIFDRELFKKIRTSSALFTARRYPSAVCTMALCPCSSVCVRVCHNSEIYRSVRTNRAGFLAWEPPSTYPTLCYREIRVHVYEVCPPNSGFREFRHGKSMVWSTKLIRRSSL